MMETWKMWRIVRYLKKNQYYFIDWDDQEEYSFSNTGNTVPEYLRDLTRILMQSRDPRIIRSFLASEFGREQYFKKHIPVNPPVLLSEAEKKMHNDIIQKNTADAQLIINDCINVGFICEDEGNKRLIFFPLKGRKFATSYGLIKEWMLNDIGEMRSVIVAIVGTVGIIKWRVAWDFIHKQLSVVF